MKAAFIFDTIIVEKENDFYGMTLNYDFFKNRYLIMYDSIVVSTRVNAYKKVKGIEGYKKLNGNDVDFIPIKNYRNPLDAINKKNKIIKELENIIDKVDVVIIRMPSVLGSFASDICYKKNKRYIIEMVACAWDGYMNHRNSFGKIIAPFMYIKTKKSVKKAPNVIYVTENFLQKRYPTNGNAYACSDVILDKTNERILKERIIKIKKTLMKELKMCTVANVEMKYKGHIYVFNAIRKLKKRGYNIKYYLIGNGDKSYLSKKAQKLNISDNIIFMGSLPHNVVFEKLESMDLYIQPSLQEGLPRALIEAMSLGMPAIGSDAGGIPELLDNTMIFRRKKVNELINIIENLDNKRLIEQAKVNFKNTIKYSPEELNSKRINFYKGV